MPLVLALELARELVPVAPPEAWVLQIKAIDLNFNRALSSRTLTVCAASPRMFAIPAPLALCLSRFRLL